MAITSAVIIEEMNGLKAFLDSLASAGSSGEVLESSQKALVRSISTKLHLVPSLDFQSGTQITETITRLGKDRVLNAAMQEQLMSAVVSKMQGQSSTTTCGRKEPQACLKAHAFLREQDWAALEGTDNMSDRLGIIRDCMHRIGLTNPDEKTRCLLVAIALCTGGREGDTPQEKYRWFRELKQLFYSFKPSRPDLPHVAAFPDHPKFLHKGWFTNAYGEGDTCPQTTCRTYPVTVVADSVPARSTHLGLRQAPPAHIAASSNPTTGLFGFGPEVMAQMAQAFQLGMAQSQQGGLPGLQVFTKVASPNEQMRKGRSRPSLGSPTLDAGSTSGDSQGQDGIQPIAASAANSTQGLPQASLAGQGLPPGQWMGVLALPPSCTFPTAAIGDRSIAGAARVCRGVRQDG